MAYYIATYVYDNYAHTQFHVQTGHWHRKHTDMHNHVRI